MHAGHRRTTAAGLFTGVTPSTPQQYVTLLLPLLSASLSVCLSVCLSAYSLPEKHARRSYLIRNFPRILLMAMAQTSMAQVSSSGDIALNAVRYVLPVSWMTSRFHMPAQSRFSLL